MIELININISSEMVSIVIISMFQSWECTFDYLLYIKYKYNIWQYITNYRLIKFFFSNYSSSILGKDMSLSLVALFSY